MNLPPHVYPGLVAAFSEVAERIGDFDELDDLLHLVATKICHLLAVARCSVYLKDEKSGLFRGQVAETGDDVDEAIKRLTAGSGADGFTNQIVTEKKPVLLLNAQTDPRPVRSTMRAWGVQTMLGVPMILKGEVIGILFLDDADKPHTYTDADQAVSQAFANLAAIAIAQARLTGELRSSLKTVASQNGVLRRAQELDDNLTKLIVEGADLHQIISAVADLTGKSCAIYKEDFQRLAIAPAPSGQPNMVPRVLDAEARKLRQVQDGIAGIREKHAGVIGPFRSAGLVHRFMLAPIVVGGVESGFLVLMEYPTRFSALDLAVIRRAAIIVALAFSSAERAAQADVHARSALVRDLLLGTDNKESLARRSALLAFDPDATHMLTLFQRKDPSSARPASAGRLAAMIDQATGDDQPPYVAQVSEGVIGILPVRGEYANARQATATVREIVDGIADRVAPDGDLIVALSSPVSGLDEFENAYVEVLEVAKCVSLFGASGSGVQTLSASELGPARVFMSASNRKDLERFSSQVLGSLLDPETEQSKELLETLDAFFRAGQRVRPAGTALGVHQNTIRYRIAKIEELTGLKLADEPNDQLSCQLALEVNRLSRATMMTTDPPAL